MWKLPGIRMVSVVDKLLQYILSVGCQLHRFFEFNWRKKPPSMKMSHTPDIISVATPSISLQLPSVNSSLFYQFTIGAWSIHFGEIWKRMLIDGAFVKLIQRIKSCTPRPNFECAALERSKKIIFVTSVIYLWQSLDNEQSFCMLLRGRMFGWHLEFGHWVCWWYIYHRTFRNS